jgi:hypothetical protein
LSKNYYENLRTRGGGLVLATDHDVYSTQGVDDLCDVLRVNRFSGFFSAFKIPVDASNPLVQAPNDLTAGLYDDSTTGLVPYGLQPNGSWLYPVAFHGGNQFTPGISSTIRNNAAFRVWISAPAPASSTSVGTPVTFVGSSQSGVLPIQYNWRSDRDGDLGFGASITVTNLSAGSHTITLTGIDASNHIDVASINLSVASLSLHIDPAVEISWSSVSGVVYQIQWAAEVSPSNWSILAPAVTGNGTTNSVFDSTRGRDKRFYRLVMP